MRELMVDFDFEEGELCTSLTCTSGRFSSRVRDWSFNLAYEVNVRYGVYSSIRAKHKSLGWVSPANAYVKILK